MKNLSILKLLALPALVGIMLSLSFCKKDVETINNTTTIHDPVLITLRDTIRINDTLYFAVHDTVSGKTVSGTATYPDYNKVNTAAKGAVVVLYSGPVMNSNLVAGYAIADANGAYSFPYLIPGTYTIYAKYNTTNTNTRAINGINFETNPAYTITISSNTTRDLALVNIASTGSIQIAIDTINANQNFRKVAFEIHSKLAFNFSDHSAGTTLAGGFNSWNVTKFAFDEANPANTVIDGYALVSTVNTFEPARDGMGMVGSKLITTGCTHATLGNYMDSAYYYAKYPDSTLTNKALAETDTARFTSISVEKYGDGYIAHGTLTAFYKHLASGPIGSSSYNYKSDTTGFAAAAGHAYDGPAVDGMISKPIDLYFTYEKQKIFSGANFNWWFVFEGQFSFRPITDFYITSSHFANGPVNVNCHVQFQGTTNKEY